MGATTLIVASAAGIAIVFPNIISAFGFVGGTGAVFIAIVFPFWIHIKDSKNKWYSPSNLIIIIGGFLLTVAGMAAAVISILDATKQVDLSEYPCIVKNATNVTMIS